MKPEYKRLLQIALFGAVWVAWNYGVIVGAAFLVVMGVLVVMFWPPIPLEEQERER